MGFGKAGAGGFTTASRRYAVGYGLVIDLEKDLPREFDEELMGRATDKGYPVKGWVVAVLGATAASVPPVVGDMVSVLVRPADGRKAIFDDLEKTKEGMRFLLDGVTGPVDALEARWVHGAGVNRKVEALEIVGAPHVSFENPVASDGPSNGWLNLSLDGSATSFDVRGRDGVFVTHELPFDIVVERLKIVLDRNLKLRVSQRVLAPSLSVLVEDDAGMEAALAGFRKDGYTACVVRSFIPGTVDSREVDVQLMSWPEDVPADNAGFAGQTYEMPVLQDTRKFVALRDGEAQALMEVIPGCIKSLIGNSDVEKSTKHKFARNIVKGLSDGQKNMYAMQSYGPAMAVSAVNEQNEATGLTRLCIRTEGAQYRNLMTIPSPHFVDADKVKYLASAAADAGVPA